MFNRNDSSNKNTFWPNKIEILQWMRLKYRSASTQLTHAKWLEIAWTIIPILILILIAIPSLKFLYYSEDPLINKSELPAISLTVIGHQWYWSYEFIGINFNNSILSNDFMNYDSYLLNIEDIVELGGLRLLDTDKPLFIPANVNTRLLITSSDVLHSWAVPSLAIKMDAVPGRTSVVNTIINLHNSIFYGQCSEICGIGHGFMPIKIISI